MPSLRAMKIRAGASGRKRWRLMFAMAALVVLQIAGVSHLIGHNAVGDNAGCAVCLAASASGGAIPPATLSLPVFHSTTSRVVELIAIPLPSRAAAGYRARAPPVSL